MEITLKYEILTPIFIALITTLITTFISNLFAYSFSLKKDSKQLYSKYKISILEELYTPIYKIIIRDLNPAMGYEGISDRQFEEIKKIVSDKYLLVDPVLDNIIWSLKEDEYINQTHLQYYFYDENRKLLDHVEKNYNKLRKSIGLPYDQGHYFKKVFSKFNYYRSRIFRKIKI